jgi:dTDP-4-dehydrorhamnose reductase
MRILVTGARGMLGRTVVPRLLADGHQVIGIDVQDCDLRHSAAVAACFAAQKPELVIHGAAVTAVDDCEGKLQELSWAVNGQGSANVALACHRVGARLIAISTDYVFAGDGDRPYHEFDVPAPRTEYGRSKLAGELAVQRHCPDHSIVRIAWLYGAGGPSFVHTMRKVLADGAAAPAMVVDDQRGNPTSCAAVADLLAWLAVNRVPGIVHGTCAGETTWCGFAAEIARLWGLPRAVSPCTTAQYPRPAPRPANSRLDKLVLRSVGAPPMPTWEEALERFRREHPEG